jgi:hypothetical protein
MGFLKQEGLKLKGAHHFLVYADGVNLVNEKKTDDVSKNTGVEIITVKT